MAAITAIGEILIDLTQTSSTDQGLPQMTANPGGAPANVAVAASRLGASTAFIGCVGRDAFGDLLRDTLEENNVDTVGISDVPSVPTTLAVVTVDDTGERGFQFYRSPGADICLTEHHVPRPLLADTKILHFGSVSLTADPSRSATLYAVRYAKVLGKLVTYDPNYRANLWADQKEAVRMMRSVLPLVDVIKLSDEETELLTGIEDPEEAAISLEKEGISLVFVTLGEEGVLCRWQRETIRAPGVPVPVADTNGAGDTFFGAVLYKLSKRNGLLDGLETEELSQILQFANHAASITVSRRGAIPAMPTLAEISNM